MPLDLVGRREIATRVGTTPGMVDTWRRRHADFPAPEWIVTGTPIWRWEEIAEWLARPRATGRPPLVRPEPKPVPGRLWRAARVAGAITVLEDEPKG